MTEFPVILSAIGAAVAIFLFITMVALRRVVPTNEVHILQSAGKTTSYGKDSKSGNVYYQWPAWLPILGVTRTILPVSVFKIELAAYEAYDVGRVPFEVDVVAFFRINDSNTSAQRVSSFRELQEQIIFIVRGAVRTVLASHDIDRIMLERSTFGEAFTKEVQEQLLQWGVIPVKNIELMDIRDGKGDQVIHNIMEKKKSFIEMQSRTEVASNKKNAAIAEIDANREAEIKKQDAAQNIGERSAQREQAIGIATQKAEQAVQEESRLTAEKTMAVAKVNQVTQAQIDQEVHIVTAEATRRTAIISAEGNKQAVVLNAEGNLQQQKLSAEGIQAQGLAKAEAEKAMQLAPVQAQITLAKEIGENPNYQNYLVTIRQVEATQAVGIEQAKAMEKADIKIISNSGDPVSGMTKTMDLFSAKGGTSLGSMLEGLAQTEQGQALLSKVLPKAAGKPNGNGAAHA